MASEAPEADNLSSKRDSNNSGENLSEENRKTRRSQGFYSTSPQVFIKLRPTTNYFNSTFQVLPDGKTLQLQHRHQGQPNPLTSPPSPEYFVSDGVLQDGSQEDIFTQVVAPVVDSAMNGVSGVILSLGPQGAGKGFTFYGDLGKYELRGILPRTFEKIYQNVEASRNEIKYGIKVGMVELYKDRIRDLISLSPYELKTVGDNGPNGMLLQPIECAEHGYSLLMRGLAGQKLMADAHANCHTLIFIEIQAQRNFLPDDEDEEKFTSYQPMKFSSRLTFAKIASLPQPSRAREAKPRPSTAAAATAAGTQPNEKVIRSDNCFFITPVPITPTTRGRDEVKSGETGEVGLWKGPIGSCCSKKPDKLTETISIRRDLLFLEQMFVSVSELRDLQGYYHTMTRECRLHIMQRPKPSQYFRQNKLCHCLRDLVSSTNHVRILLHLRPELDFIHTVVDALRFAERLRAVPRTVAPGGGSADKLATLSSLRLEIQVLREELDRVSKSTRRALRGNDTLQLSPSRTEFLQQQAVEYANGKIDQLDVESKAEAKALFENLRSLFQATQTEGTVRRTSPLPLSKSLTKLRTRKPSMNSSFGKGQQGQPEYSSASLQKSSKKKVKGEKSRRKKGKKGQRGSRGPAEGLPTAEVSHSKFDLSGVNLHGDKGDGFPTLEDSLGHEELVEKLGLPPKIDALEEFSKTEAGSRLAQDLRLHETRLQDAIAEHTEALQSAKEFFKTVAEKQAEFDGMQAERHTKGDEYDLSGNLIVPKKERDLLIVLRVMKEGRDQKMTELRSIQMELGKQKIAVKSYKSEFEAQFQIFCLEQFAGIRDAEEQGAGDSDLNLNPEFQSKQPDIGHPDFCNLFGFQGQGGVIRAEDASKNFSSLHRAALEQAKEIAKYYQAKPRWRNNYK